MWYEAWALIEKLIGRRAARWYLGVTLVLTLLSGAVYWLVVPPTGLLRTFYLRHGLDRLPFPPERTSDISLAFLRDKPNLPQRFFGVEWTGYWYLSRHTNGRAVRGRG